MPFQLREGFAYIMFIHCFPNLFFNKPLHFLFLWQLKQVFGYEEVIVHAGQSVFDEGVVFVRTEQNADRWIITFDHHIFPIPAHIGIELAYIFMAELF